MTTATFSRTGTGGWMLHSGWHPMIPPICKGIGGRWSPTAKAWRFASLLQAQQAAAELRHVGITVIADWADPVAIASNLDTAFAALFAALPTSSREPAYKALVRALHPDRGGDTATMQALTAAWDRSGVAA